MGTWCSASMRCQPARIAIRFVANLDRGMVTKPNNLLNRLGTRHGLRVRRGEDLVECLFDYATYTVTFFRGEKATVRSTSDLPMQMIETTLFRAGVPLHGVKRRDEKMNNRPLRGSVRDR